MRCLWSYDVSRHDTEQTSLLCSPLSKGHCSISVLLLSEATLQTNSPEYGGISLEKIREQKRDPRERVDVTFWQWVGESSRHATHDWLKSLSSVIGHQKRKNNGAFHLYSEVGIFHTTSQCSEDEMFQPCLYEQNTT
ncbi:hypothetical protein ILYODFUR_038183 [Ilyodon furcidens]|uniref:Uncharacterized protein n=1 Tax=Ilyodon furcidens TaxID=33524 RepID=A0ABV0SSL5_9TELE